MKALHNNTINTGENNSKRNFSVSVLWPVPIWRISNSQIACPLIFTSISMKRLSRLLEGNMSYGHISGENVTAPRRYRPSYIAEDDNQMDLQNCELEADRHKDNIKVDL